MKASTTLLAMALSALACAPAAAGGQRHERVYLVAPEGPIGHHGTRFHRTAREDGFFAHGNVGRGGRFEYDRGYPYDYYWDGAEEEYAEAREPMPSGRGCETKWVRHGRSGNAEVRVCR